MATPQQQVRMPKLLCAAEPPAGATLSLHVFDDQFLVQYRGEHGALITKFVSPESVRQAVLDENVDSGYLPYGVVRWGCGVEGAWAVRYEPPARRRIYLDVPGAASEPLVVPLPALVFTGRGNQYFVFAVAGSHFSPRSTLYRAPLPNVADTGEICFGKNNVAAVAEGGMERAFDLFFAAPFNDHHAEGRSQQYAADVRLQLRALAERRAAKYPMRDLIKLNHTVDEVVNRLALGR